MKLYQNLLGQALRLCSMQLQKSTQEIILVGFSFSFFLGGGGDACNLDMKVIQ